MKTFNLEKFAASPFAVSFLHHLDNMVARDNAARGNYVDPADGMFRKDGNSACNGLAAEDFHHNGGTVSICGLLATLNGCDQVKKWRGTDFFKEGGRFVEQLLRMKRPHLFRAARVRPSANRASGSAKYAEILGDLA